MRFLVTGATGFVGGAITRHLLKNGHSVKALVRPGSRVAYPALPNLEIAVGDVTDPASVEAAMNDIEGVFHCAAVYSYWHSDPAKTYRTNVDGTEFVLKAARNAGVRRVVLTSTVATLKWPGKGRLADESSVATLDDLSGHYKRSKLMAEQAALAISGGDLEVVITNPTAPFGPGDARPTPTGRIVLEFLNNRFPGYVDTSVNVCDVDDIAAGHELAFLHGKPGERYILGSQNVSLRGIYDRLGKVTGLKRLPLRVPFVLATAAGMIDSFVEGKVLRREPYIPVEGIRVAKHPMLVDCTKAVIELGLPTRPAVESLRRSATWFVENGYSKARISGLGSREAHDETGGTA